MALALNIDYITGNVYLFDDTDAGGGITDAPMNGKLYGRQDGRWMEIVDGENFTVLDGGNI